MFIYENPDWPRFIVNEARLGNRLSLLNERKAFLDGSLSVFADRNQEAAQGLSESLVASWLIEGVSLSEIDVYSSVAKRLGIPYPVKETRPYIDGITAVLLDALQNHSPMTVERLFSWHGDIVAGTPGVVGGRFRTGSIYVVSGKYRNTGIVYEAPPASAVAGMMDDLISFVNHSRYPDPIVSAIAHYFLVAVHPFEDGNGRTARMLSDYILQRNSDMLPAVLVSSEIKKQQKEYYEILSITSRSSSMDITEWVEWFLCRMCDAYEAGILRVQKSFRVREFFIRAEKYGLNERQMKFLSRVLREDWTGAITARKYAVITGCHPDTANRDLKKLVALGLIRQEEGGSRNTHYSVIL